MIIHYCSDLHTNVQDIELPGGDILILAGDIAEMGHIRLFQNTGRNEFLVDRYKRFFLEESSKYRQVVWIPGNHEHYHSYFEETVDLMKSLAPPNLTVLNSSSIEIDGVPIWGGTMWTNFNNQCPISIETIRNSMNDYNLIRYQHGKFTSKQFWTNKLTPYCVLDEHYEDLNLLSNFLEDNKDKPSIVITHHAPSAQSIHPKYAHEIYLNGAYFSNLEHIMFDNPQIKLWVHGHVHNEFDYMVNQTRVVCNPRGYAGYEERAENFVVKQIDFNTLIEHTEQQGDNTQ